MRTSKTAASRTAGAGPSGCSGSAVRPFSICEWWKGLMVDTQRTGQTVKQHRGEWQPSSQPAERPKSNKTLIETWCYFGTRKYGYNIHEGQVLMWTVTFSKTSSLLHHKAGKSKMITHLPLAKLKATLRNFLMLMLTCLDVLWMFLVSAVRRLVS